MCVCVWALAVKKQGLDVAEACNGRYMYVCMYVSVYAFMYVCMYGVWALSLRSKASTLQRHATVDTCMCVWSVCECVCVCVWALAVKKQGLNVAEAYNGIYMYVCIYVSVYVCMCVCMYGV